MGNGHLDPAILGAIAAGVRAPAGYGPVERRHLGGCPSCAAELAALRRIAAGRAYPAPPERVWSGIVGGLARPGAALAEPAGRRAPAARAPARLRPLLTGAVRLAAGVALGIGAAAVARRFVRPRAAARSPAPARRRCGRARRPRG
ncbi:hypothetical protein [Streptomyces sp. CC228A]|uniref:hypothetical protein n=1 Tax=Streptomyces sp. CC228A TaxID=2898186 RepID=UPI001F2D1404|nr:hypothetical protein [Streptomyces sp. CC228A]